MDTEIEPDSMAGAVAEVPLGTPERHARERIELVACGAAWEHRHRQVDHTLENQRVVFLFKWGAFAHWDGAGNICRACKVLSAGVHEVQALRAYNRRAFAWGRIVRKGTRRSIGRDVLEAVSAVARHL